MLKYHVYIFVADKVSSSKNLSTKNDPILSTSTPARSEFGNVVYGFDLSPVHSYEIPATQTSPIKVYLYCSRDF